MNATTAIAIFGPPAGIFLGWALSLLTTRWERSYAECQEVRRRKEDAAAQFDREIMESMREAPAGVVVARDAADRLWAVAGQLRTARARYAVLDDAEIEERWRSLDMAIFIASQQVPRSGPDAEINLWALSIASAELRQALTAYQQREQPLAADFPRVSELIEMTNEGPVEQRGIEAVNRYLAGRMSA